MRKYVLIAAFSCLAATACSTGPQSDIFSLPKAKSGNVIATVNGVEIREGLLEILSTLSPRLKAQLDNPITRKKVLSSLIEQQLLYQEAMKRGLDRDEDVEVKSLLNRHTIVSNTLLEKELDTSMRKAYEERKADQFTQIDISQIVFNFLPESADKNAKPTDEQKQAALEKAKAAKAHLDKGGDFAAVAKEVSDDKRTSAKGGQAGAVAKDDKRMARLGLKAVAEKAFALKKDEVSEPVETTQGYYIVKATSDPKVTPYEDAKRVLGFELQASVKTTLLEGLKKSATIQYADAKTATAMAKSDNATKAAPKPHAHGDAHPADPKTAKKPN